MEPKPATEGSALNVMAGTRAPENIGYRPRKRRAVLSAEEYVAGVRGGDRVVLGRALTLMESTAARHRDLAAEVLERLMPYTGQAVRLGISGVPGAGKSTFIEAFSVSLLEEGKRVAVLAIDPSSQISGGSILGDKTRMTRLSLHERALVRPSPSGNWAGGVARSTREAMLVLEAAGFDVVIIETVGVGQGEMQAASMVDFFLLLALPGAGDELQAMKRGILEMADAIAVNKADGELLQAAERAKAQYENTLRAIRSPQEAWHPRVFTCSAVKEEGLTEIWQCVRQHRAWAESIGRLGERRAQQNEYWLQQTLEGLLRDRFRSHPKVRERLPVLQGQIRAGTKSPFRAAEELVESVLTPPEDEKASRKES